MAGQPPRRKIHCRDIWPEILNLPVLILPVLILPVLILPVLILPAQP